MIKVYKMLLSIYDNFSVFSTV